MFPHVRARVMFGNTRPTRPSIQVMARSRRVVRVGDGLVKAIWRVEDVRTGTQLAHICHTSRRTLQRRCKELHTSARSCLQFVWCGRVVAKRTGPWDPDAELTACCADGRTRRRLIKRGALDRPTRPGFGEFLDQQTIVTTPSLMVEIRAAWRRATAVYVGVSTDMVEAVVAGITSAV